MLQHSQKGDLQAVFTRRNVAFRNEAERVRQTAPRTAHGRLAGQLQRAKPRHDDDVALDTLILA